MKRLLAVLVLALIPLIGYAQQKPEEPKEVTKPFPPASSARFSEAQKEVELAQARLANAQANLRLLLYAIADEVELTKIEKETCPFAQTANGTWVFKCPPAKPPEAKKPSEVKPKERKQ